jgi:hypothetical protein
MAVVCLVAGQGARTTATLVDFSGTWTLSSLEMKQKVEAGGSVGIRPPDQVITQTVSTLDISETVFDIVKTTSLALDGTPSTNRSGAQVSVTRSHWVGKTLVTEGKVSQTTSAGYDEWTIKETRSLTPAGVMMIESEHIGRDGNVTASVRQYKRKP